MGTDPYALKVAHFCISWQQPLHAAGKHLSHRPLCVDLWDEQHLAAMQVTSSLHALCHRRALAALAARFQQS